MPGLSPRAREVVYAGRTVSQPTAADRRRIEEALRARLGTGVLPVELVRASFAARLRWPFAATALVGAVLLVSAAVLAFRSEPAATNSVPPRPVPSVARVPNIPTVAATQPDLPSPPAPPPVVAVEPLRASPPKEDALAREVALLSRATGDLRAGRASDALKALDEHRRTFPDGILKEERRAGRVQALCALGRQAEASIELAQLAPQSLAAVNAKRVCEESSRAER